MWCCAIKMQSDPTQEDPYRLLRETGGRAGHSSYPGWGKDCWEAGHTAVVEAGSFVAWAKERSAVREARLPGAPGLRKESWLLLCCSAHIPFLWDHVMTIKACQPFAYQQMGLK